MWELSERYLSSAATTYHQTNKYMDDIVNHPPHYTSHPSGIEAIQVTQHMGFCLGNAMKYLWRAGKKDPAAEITDLRKAIWYIEREILRLQTPHGK